MHHRKVMKDTSNILYKKIKRCDDLFYRWRKAIRSLPLASEDSSLEVLVEQVDHFFLLAFDLRFRSAL